MGYSFTFTAKNNMTIGILPIGYNDGIDRRLSNKGLVKLGNIDCRIIGRISMNITTIDISEVKSPKVGSEVIVYSAKNLDKNSIRNMAEAANTIPYTLLTGLTMSIKRIVK